MSVLAVVIHIGQDVKHIARRSAVILSDLRLIFYVTRAKAYGSQNLREYTDN